jgi:hypothetical protein
MTIINNSPGTLQGPIRIALGGLDPRLTLRNGTTVLGHDDFITLTNNNVEQGFKATFPVQFAGPPGIQVNFLVEMFAGT